MDWGKLSVITRASVNITSFWITNNVFFSIETFMTQNLNPHLTWDSSLLKINITFKCSKIYKEPTIVTSLKKKNLLFPVVGVEGGGVLESIPLPYYISFTPHLKLVTFGRISFPQSQFSHFQFMYLPYKASKKVILKWIDSFDGEFSHFKNTTYQNLLPHKILEMQPPLQSIQSWKCGPTQRHISTSLLIENTFPQALTIDELR